VRRWLGLPALMLLGAQFCGVANAADDAALKVVEACRARLDARTDIGMERVQKRCPELIGALQNASWRDLLPKSIVERREEITAESLRALTELVRKAAETAPPGATLNARVLPEVLAELGEQGQQGATRWERFKRWLKQKLEGRKDDDQRGWLAEWSDQFRSSEGVARAITYFGYLMVVLLVLFVVWSELRAAGIFGGSRTRRGRENPAAEWRRRLMLADVSAAPLADRPGMLLRLLGEALTRAHRLPSAEGMTAGAIARQARLDADAERVELARVASTADEIRYASHKPQEQDLEDVVASARTLLARFARLKGDGR
jgi:hypothetical protein